MTTEDVFAAGTHHKLMSTMKGVESKQLVECMICGVLVGSVFSYHKHNVRQHSLAQLSRAILKLRNLKLPLVDPGEENATDEGDDDEDEDVMSGGINDPMDVLKLPVKVEVMDEVIELGPTDNSDHLQVQSRLLNSSDEASQHSNHVIEVKENHPRLASSTPWWRTPMPSPLSSIRSWLQPGTTAPPLCSSLRPERRARRGTLKS